MLSELIQLLNLQSELMNNVSIHDVHCTIIIFFEGGGVVDLDVILLDVL